MCYVYYAVYLYNPSFTWEFKFQIPNSNNIYAFQFSWGIIDQANWIMLISKLFLSKPGSKPIQTI